MLSRMLWRSLFEGRRRKLLAAVTVALSAALITTLFALSVDVGDKMAREMKSYGSNIKVSPKSEAMPLIIDGVDYNPLKDQDTLAESELPKIKDIFWRNNIVGLAPWLGVQVRAEGAGLADGREVNLIGTYFEHPVPLPDDPEYRTGVKAINPFWAVAGAWPDDSTLDRPADQVLVGAGLAARTGLAEGDRLELRPQGEEGAAPQAVTVTGILTTGGPEDDAIVAPLALVQALTGLEGQVQSVDVSALTIPENELSNKARRDTGALSAEEYDVWYCTAYVSSIAHQIEEAVANAAARPIWQVAASEGAVIGRIQMLLLTVSLAAIIAAAMAVSSLMNTTVMERSREIGLMKALGAAPWEIHALFIGEAAIVGLIGGAIGLVVGYGVAQFVGLSVFGSGVELTPITIPIVLVVSVATVMLGSILPARSIASLSPSKVLHGH
ncbi:ABC transporter permease [Consotaella aegiceratis]|uniref:ABC transporter permease n=1 Tax=Consotaella aegiceratis TaxID=3097961 RepID=UPI002F3F1D5E